MKYIITESQLDTFTNYLNATFDALFDIDNLMYGPSEEDGEEDYGKWDFYKTGRGGIRVIFSWFDYDAPIVKIYGGVGRELDDEFGNIWQDAFKLWFMDNFGKPVARIKY